MTERSKKPSNKMKLGKKKDGAPKTGSEPAKKDEKKDETKDQSSTGPKVPDVVIDFDGLNDRLKRVSIPNAQESSLFWSPDSKKLAFIATIEGQKGTYTIEPQEDLKPKKFSAITGSAPRWLDAGNQVVWIVAGSPASLTAGGKESTYRFRALQEVSRSERFKAGFDQAWRVMRDQWYDERMGNRNWDSIRRKYSDAAAQAPDLETLATVVQLMLGEINGSHLGFYPGVSTRPDPTSGEPVATGPSWKPVTAYLGARFDPAHKGRQNLQWIDC